MKILRGTHHRRLLIVALLFFFLSDFADAQSPYDSVARRIAATALTQNYTIGLLKELCAVGPRLSGSPQAAKAVAWAEKTMKRFGFDNVRLEPVTVPHWVRGPKEEAVALASRMRKIIPLSVTALGGSIATPKKGITAGVVEVRSFEELHALGDAAKGRIVFFNRPMDRGQMSTFSAYGGAVDQRGSGAVEAAKVGAVAALVRSMTTTIDDQPHTGGMRYAEGVTKVPAAAVSTLDADALSALLKTDPKARVRLVLSCETMPDIPSFNVVGEIRGSEKPDEVVVIGGHLDSWDKGDGAHDDAGGCSQSIEALRLLKELGLTPKRTIRAVMFMNEENGLRGGTAYAAMDRPGEKHIAAIESDEGAFAPRGFGVGDSTAHAKLKAWEPVFAFMNADRIVLGGGGADIGPLARKGVPPIGLNVESHRYFDYHHSHNDTVDKVNERELALGAAAMAVLAYIISQEGL